MFDLEQSIADWRKQMLAAGIKTPVPLEELEIHLREEIERQIKLGLSLNEQEAFHFSTRKIGQPKMLKNEFNKSERTFMRRTIIISAGIIGVAVGMGFVTPAIAKYNEQGTMVHDATIGFLIGIPIVFAGISMAIYGFKKRKA
ncbi:MAG TPA: hypothetical protein VGM58_04875 [Verrucomicrobiae bacterium]|jgi:hypothetical protein